MDGEGMVIFAVFFGGAVALLPIFATDILHVGARGLGFLEATDPIKSRIGEGPTLFFSLLVCSYLPVLIWSKIF